MCQNVSKTHLMRKQILELWTIGQEVARQNNNTKPQNLVRNHLTYLPHKAVVEVSRDKEPIGRGCVEFNWFESQLMSDSSEVTFK